MRSGTAPGGTATTCVGEPLSWLLIERHLLGELSAAEAARVEAHLIACPTCAACVAEANRPLSFELPGAPIGSVATQAVSSGALPGASPRVRSRRANWLAGATFAAAAAALLLLVRPADRPGSRPGSVARGASDTLTGIKGGDVAIDLVRERRGEIEHGAETFGAQDRWKVLLTCPSDGVLFWDLVVYENGQARFPLSPVAPIACGNHVALPGAFRLSGVQPVRVCVVSSRDPVDWRRLPASPPGDQANATAGNVCVTLRPED